MLIRVKVDNLGRITIPKFVRDAHDYNPGDRFVITTEENNLIITKLKENCIFCDEPTTIIFNGKLICSTCMGVLKQHTKTS